MSTRRRVPGHAVEHRRRAASQCRPVPIFYASRPAGPVAGWAATMPDLYRLLFAPSGTSISGLFVFNILPVYPLDGGQILRSLLWFVLGRARSLMVATVLGLIGVAGFIILGIREQGCLARSHRRFHAHELLGRL